MAFTGQTSSIDCATLDASSYKAGSSATRSCTGGVYQDIVKDACVWVDCAAVAPWAATADGATDSVACNLINDNYSDLASAERVCTESVWGPVVETKCHDALAQGVFWCPEAHGFPRAWTDDFAEQPCKNLKLDKHKGMYDGNTNAKIQCKNNGDDTASFDLETLDVSACTKKQCSIHPELGFKKTDVEKLSKLACKDYSATMIAKDGKDGNATLMCELIDGEAKWSDEVDVSECHDTSADSSARLCSIGAGILSAACVAAAI
jgi:hypothetical protein